MDALFWAKIPQQADHPIEMQRGILVTLQAMSIRSRRWP